MSTVTFRKLDVLDRALVCIGVLLDGSDAAVYLEFDSQEGQGLKDAAEELAKLPFDARMPFVGTLLRLALEESTGNR